jgi:hypothetical protein
MSRMFRYLAIGYVLTACCVLCLIGGIWTFLRAEESGLTNQTVPSTATVQSLAKDGVCQFLLNGKPILEYRYPSRGPKSYVSLLTTPAGTNVLRDSPPDHVHHHALMFAVGIDGVDYWAEGPGCGVQIPQADFRCDSQKSGERLVYRLFHKLRWQVPDGGDQLLEDRTIELIRDSRFSGATLLVWKAKLTVPADHEKVELWGRPYFGLGLRFVESMDRDGKLFNSLGNAGVQGTNNQRAQWCAYTAKVDDRPVTVVVMDEPQNPRAPATWFTMDQPFAYVSATLNLAAEKLDVTAGKPIVLTYGVAVCDGVLEQSDVQNLYSAFCQHVQ